MIPEFPHFKKLELADKKDVEKFTQKYPPYSDFNFVSMWSWDIKGEMLLSTLNDNLVVRFTDYLTGEPFYSFLGNNKVNETAEKLLGLSKKEGFKPMLKLLPEDSIKNIDISKFKIQEDRDNFDYIYSIPILSELKGGIYETHRNLIHQFLKINKDWEVSVIDFREIYNKNSILSLFTQWAKNKGDSLLLEEYKNEFLALNKLLSIEDTKKINLVCFALYVEKKLVGFIINELVYNEYNIIHFEKADASYKGCYPFLMQQNLKNLNNFHVKYLNFEQDLGIDSLRFTKKKFHPISFLKKYLVTK